MKSFYLIDYIAENSELDKDIFDILRVELSSRIYFYGQQFKNPREGYNEPRSIKNKIINYGLILWGIKNQLFVKKSDKKIRSNAYFTFNSELGKLGFNVYRPIWLPSLKTLIDNSTFQKTKKMKYEIEDNDFTDLIF